MRDGMPHGTSLFGSAARVYSKDLDWVTDPKSSPLRVAHGSADTRYIAEQIIDDVLNKIPSPATFAAPATREGTIEAILAGGSRAVARLQDGTQALIRQEDALPGIPLDWLYNPGNQLAGPSTRAPGPSMSPGPSPSPAPARPGKREERPDARASPLSRKREPDGNGQTYRTAHLPQPRDHGLNRDTPKSLPRRRWHAPSMASARRRCSLIGFPHTPRRPYRRPAPDAALDPCSATKTSSCLERNESSSSRSTRKDAAGAARPGIDRYR